MTPLPEALRAVPLAHRALHDRQARRPENSRAAIRAAVDAGYGIEIDLQCTRDGQAVVFHDDALDRLTGRAGRVQDISAAELARLPLLGGEDGAPGFAEVLDMVGGRVPLLVELKDQQGAMEGSDERLEAAVAAALRGYAGPLALMSFNPHQVIALARLCPDAPRGIVTSAYRARDWPELTKATRDRLRAVPDYAAAGACFISHEADDLARPRVAELKAEGAAVLCWTIRSPQEEAAARRVADNITFEGYLPPLTA
ncbi:phosphodiesterase [Roseovarius spongiae]|uniref:Phosphodiesterase n=1 Tax=Roseovarius spongiae TaxID=2320272 RepID=A0A3A8AQU6_9RHOB|nr:glycerophosphodiester phosphodiesterase family protein [Roseovarius spongiae]RKF12878.1 phosphodiesterase [Roseovarius spongiae]